MSELRKNFKLKEIVFINFVNMNRKEKELVRQWRNNKNIRKWMYSSHIISYKEQNTFVKNLKNNNRDFYWLVKNEKNGEYIGVIYLNRVDFYKRNAYLGIYVNPELIGVGNLVMESLKELAFKIAKFHTLKLEVIEANERAIKFYKKAGFKEEGRLKEFVFKDSRWLDVVVMGLANKNG